MSAQCCAIDAPVSEMMTVPSVGMEQRVHMLPPSPGWKLGSRRGPSTAGFALLLAGLAL